MSTPLIPQEIYLLERYSSLDHFGDMRDAWVAMLNHVEALFERFMRNLPLNYRNRPLPEQPDVVWGQRVLPNFRDPMLGLDAAFIELSHGDSNALNEAHRVLNDERGQREFSYDWMDEVEPDGSEKYWTLLSKAGRHASNIAPTAGAYWNPGALTVRYNSDRSPLDPPPTWPQYRLNPSVRVKTGDPVPRTGVYLPEIDDSGAQFLIEGQEAAPASVGYNPDTMQYVSEEPTTWTLVERIADSGGGVPGVEFVISRLRCEANQPCPREGWWFTPAMAGSRRYFSTGETMPDFKSDYGTTIWQWDEQQ